MGGALRQGRSHMFARYVNGLYMFISAEYAIVIPLVAFTVIGGLLLLAIVCNQLYNVSVWYVHNLCVSLWVYIFVCVFKQCVCMFKQCVYVCFFYVDVCIQLSTVCCVCVCVRFMLFVSVCECMCVCVCACVCAECMYILQVHFFFFLTIGQNPKGTPSFLTYEERKAL